jgi:hypothetical protein
MSVLPPRLDIAQLLHLEQFFQIKEEHGVEAAVEWAERVIAENEAPTKKAQPKLSLVR